MKIPESSRILSIDLRINNLDKMLNFYSGALGLRIIERTGTAAFLTSGIKVPYLIGLFEDKQSPMPARYSPGLYHLALRYPGRKPLAESFSKLHEKKTEFAGFSDHIVSEALYLADPEGNGIELYADRPSNSWDWRGNEVNMATYPLDLADLMSELKAGDKIPGELQKIDIGHIHLRVSGLQKAESFYNGILGFDITNKSYPGAMFFSAGGYHHHIGTNTWSVNGSAVQEGSLGLISFTIAVSDIDYLKTVMKTAEAAGLLESSESETQFTIRDFDGNRVHLVLL